MDIKEISDRLELEKLVNDYATAVDTKNFTEFYNLFTSDAFIDYSAVGGISGNLEEIIAYLETALDFFRIISILFQIYPSLFQETMQLEK